MKIITEVTIKMVSDIPEHEADVMRMTFESGDIMEIARVQQTEQLVDLLSLQEQDEVHVSYNLIEDEEDDEE